MMTLIIMAITIMTLCIMTFSIMTLRIMTMSITTFSMLVNKTSLMTLGNVVMLSDVMINVGLLCVVMLSVVAPYFDNVIKPFFSFSLFFLPKSY